MKATLRKAFHDRLAIHAVPVGLAVGTDFALSNGEPLGFYVVGPDASGHYRLEDDGTTVPTIEAMKATQNETIERLCGEYGALYNADTGELSTLPLPKDAVPHNAIRFVALLLCLSELAAPHQNRAASASAREFLNQETIVH
jgi:hypothetical protein